MGLVNSLLQSNEKRLEHLERYHHPVDPDKRKTAWVFSGQGSQVLGMGKDLWRLPQAKDTLRKAESILRWSVEEACNDEVKLNDTRYCQPCLFVVSSLLIDLLKEEGCKPDFVAGYSLGEYCALYAAEVFDFESGLNLLKRRAALMAAAPDGVMAVLLGYNRRALEQYVQSSEDVELVSDEKGRGVIAGTEVAVEKLAAKVKPLRLKKLNVLKPFHTKFMETSEMAFQSVLNEILFAKACIPVLSNSNPYPTSSAYLIKQRLRRHMTAQIQWDATIDRLSQENVVKIVEVSPSNMLTKALQRASLGFELSSINNFNDVKAVEVSNIKIDKIEFKM